MIMKGKNVRDWLYVEDHCKASTSFCKKAEWAKFITWAATMK